MILRRHPLLCLFIAAAISLGLLSLFYLYCFHFHVWPEYLFINASRLFEPALCFIILLLIIVVILALGLIVLMRNHADRLEKEIVDRIAAEKSRDEVKQALLQSQKLEAVGMLAGGIAHNFNNILYAIQGYVQMARSDVDTDSVSYQNLGKVLDVVQRGQELVQGILHFSRREHYQFENICLRDVLESAVQLLQSTLSATIELQLIIHLESSVLRGNRTQLQQVFINIIQNAADALGEKGAITVTAMLAANDDSLKLLRPGLPYESYYVVMIADNGSGMSDETLRHLFEPFFTTKDVGKGTGLGLATARSIVRDHRGEVVVQSVPGKGSTFTILLPVNTREKEQE